jgi:nucleolar protein 56
MFVSCPFLIIYKAFYILFESAAGYGLFQRTEMQEAASQTDEIQTAIKSFPLFSKMVKQIAFVPYVSAESALENINAVSEGILSEFLRTFLETTLPTKNRSKITVGVAEDKLGSSIQDEFSVSCVKTGPVQVYLLSLSLSLFYHQISCVFSNIFAYCFDRN